MNILWRRNIVRKNQQQQFVKIVLQHEYGCVVAASGNHYNAMASALKREQEKISLNHNHQYSQRREWFTTTVENTRSNFTIGTQNELEGGITRDDNSDYIASSNIDMLEPKKTVPSTTLSLLQQPQEFGCKHIPGWSTITNGDNNHINLSSTSVESTLGTSCFQHDSMATPLKDLEEIILQIDVGTSMHQLNEVKDDYPSSKSISATKTVNNNNNKTWFYNDTATIMRRSREICDEAKFPIGIFVHKPGTYRYFKMVYKNAIRKAQSLVAQNSNKLPNNYHIRNNGTGTTNKSPEEMTNRTNTATQLSHTLNAAFLLLIRICREPWKESNFRRYSKPHQYTIILFQTWTVAALKNEPNLLSSYDVTQLLREISYNQFYTQQHDYQPKWDVTTLGNILHVLLHETTNNNLSSSMVLHKLDNLQEGDRSIVAMLPQFLLASTQQLAAVNDDDSEQPVQRTLESSPGNTTKNNIFVLYLYDELMKAHAESKNSNVAETIQNMYDLIDVMRTKYSIKPRVNTFNILLRFLRLSDRTSSDSNFEFAFIMMQLDQILPDLSTYNEVVQFYIHQSQLNLAEQYLQQMIDMTMNMGHIDDSFDASATNEVKEKRSDMSLITLAAQCLMDAYMREFMEQSSTQRRPEMVGRAQTLFLLMDKMNASSGTITLQLLRTMMDMYARSGNPDAAKTILSKVMNPSVSMYGFMIKAYGEADNINDAITVFRSMLEDHRVTPNISTFNILLNACAQSKVLGPAAFCQATELVHLLGSNERCVQLQLRCDQVTYNTLLKCLTKASPSSESASVHAEAILLEMEQRQKSDQRVKADLITYTLAIRVCLRVNDQHRMDIFINKMQQSNIRTDTELCNTILSHYAQIGTEDSAERAESFLSNLNVMSQTDISVKPNLYTYNIVLNAWGRSNHPNFAHRMWLVYQRMINENVIPDYVTYSTLLKHLTKQYDSVGTADKILQESENNIEKDGRFQPDFYCYDMVIRSHIKFCDADSATRLLFRLFAISRNNYVTMHERNHDKKIRDSLVQMYHELTETWIKQGDVEYATLSIEKIFNLYVDDTKKQRTIPLRNGNVPVEAPSALTYRLLYNTWDKSRHPAKETYLAKMKARIDSYQ